MTPTEKHRETAKQIVDGVLMNDLDVIAVAAIVANAEREGMKRAAEIARTAETPDEGEYWIANRIASAILSECREG